ncbi:ABC-2 type transport system ATP-binding protein [Catenulispora sp. GP43]|uniref:ABC transporter ATP-binding protein n=1 Tax=Catenulispora sp. GP43 TaxID=3156263 RepID=UPI0035187FCD
MAWLDVAQADPEPAGARVREPRAVVLNADSLVKRFGDRTVVDGISVRVAVGEIVGFLGPNGAGKSTSIAMFTGALRPDTGTVHVDGVDMAAEPRRAKRLIGVVPQEIALYPSLSARQNLRFFAGAYRLPNKLRRERIAWALDVVDLADRADDRVSSYSGGMQRRVNIAAALLHQPRLLFMDEPTVGVDAQSRDQIFAAVLRLRDELGMSVVYTSHYMPEVERLCDRFVVVDDGRVIAEGTHGELLRPLGEGLLEWSATEQELALLPDGVQSLAARLARHGEIEVVPAPSGQGPDVLRLRAHSMAGALREVAQIAADHTIGLGGIRLGRPDLESLFLSLTGRHVRDGA